MTTIENLLVSPRKLMVRAPNWVGDAIISLPAVHALRQRYPKAELVVVAKPWVADIYRSQSWVSDVILYDSKKRHRGPWRFRRLVGALRREKFDAAVLFPNAFQAAWMAWRADIPIRIGYATEHRGSLLTTPLPVPSPSVVGHQAYYYLHLLWQVGIIQGTDRHPKPHLEVPERILTLAQHRLRQLGVTVSGPILGIHPGASFGPAKRWLPERFAELADRLMEESSCQVLFFGSPGEEPLAKEICRRMRQKAVNLAGATTLLEFMALAKSCHAFVSNDSGPMHLAAALGVPLVALFGSTDERATGPLGQQIKIVKSPAECSPCLLRTCPIDFRCMKNIAVDQVFEAVSSLLKERNHREIPAPEVART